MLHSFLRVSKPIARLVPKPIARGIFFLSKQKQTKQSKPNIKQFFELYRNFAFAYLEI